MHYSQNAYFFCIALSLSLGLSNAQGAEDDLVLLSFDGDLIGLMDSYDGEMETSEQATQLIFAYHQLLTIQLRTEVDSLHDQIVKFVPGFEVAYTAADSAEIAHIMSEIDIRLANIQEIHEQNYTQGVVDLLTEAYQLILPTFGDEQ